MLEADKNADERRELAPGAGVSEQLGRARSKSNWHQNSHFLPFGGGAIANRKGTDAAGCKTSTATAVATGPGASALTPSRRLAGTANVSERHHARRDLYVDENAVLRFNERVLEDAQGASRYEPLAPGPI